MKKLITIFSLTGIMYVFMEVAYTSIITGQARLVGHSSLWMMLVGGMLGVVLGLINERKSLKNIDYRLKVLIGGACITALEFVSGCILNLWLGFDIWDYSKAFGNLLGQIDVLHSFYWMGISPFVFWTDDVIRHYIFKEEKPKSLFSYYKRIIKG
jgi:uncharacterized membrane protein